MPSTVEAPTHQKVGREWREPWLPKGVRRVGRGRSFQQRHYIGPKKVVYPFNLGCYASPAEADRIGRKFRKLWAGGMTPWEALTSLIASGDVSPNISSKWVFPVPLGWAVRARCRGREVFLPGPFIDAAAARQAAAFSLTQLLQTSPVA